MSIFDKWIIDEWMGKIWFGVKKNWFCGRKITSISNHIKIEKKTIKYEIYRFYSSSSSETKFSQIWVEYNSYHTNSQWQYGYVGWILRFQTKNFIYQSNLTIIQKYIKNWLFVFNFVFKKWKLTYKSNH